MERTITNEHLVAPADIGQEVEAIFFLKLGSCYMNVVICGFTFFNFFTYFHVQSLHVFILLLFFTYMVSNTNHVG
jgi:hypothetical protein